MMSAKAATPSRSRFALSKTPRRVVVGTVIATLVLAPIGVVAGRLSAPHPAASTVTVAPMSASGQGDPIIRPERLELPQ